MVKLTIKTLNTGDYPFEFDEKRTVKDFKDHIAPTVNVPTDRQRLIFQGKVLKDDQTLESYRIVDEKVIHLVERAPPSSVPPSQNFGDAVRVQSRPNRRVQSNTYMSAFTLPNVELDAQRLNQIVQRVLENLGDVGRRTRTRTTMSPSGEGLEVQIQVLGANSGPELESPALQRVRHIRHVLKHLEHVVYHLENPDDEAVDEQHPAGQCPHLAHNCDEFERSQAAAAVTSDQQSVGDGAEPPRPRQLHASMAMLADLMGETMALQDRVRPFVARYQEIMREERDFTNENEAGRRASRFFNSMQVLFHNLAHVLHTLSDLNVHFCDQPPRNLYPQLPDSALSEAAGPDAEITLHFQLAPVTIAPPPVVVNDPAAVQTPPPQQDATSVQPPQAVAPNQAQPLRPQAAAGEQIPGGIYGPFSIQDPQGNPGMMFMQLGNNHVSVQVASISAEVRQIATPDGGPPTTDTVAAAAQQPVAQATPPPQFSAAAQPQQALPRGQTQHPMPPGMQQMMQEAFAGLAGAMAGAAAGGGLRPRAPGVPMARRAVMPGFRPPRPFLAQRAAAYPSAPYIRGPNGQPLPVFVGGGAPESLPLFTADPFLPCASRHFAIEHERQQRSVRSQQQQQAASGVNATPATAATEPSASAQDGETAAATASNNSPEVDQLVIFERELERLLRSTLGQVGQTTRNFVFSGAAVDGRHGGDSHRQQTPHGADLPHMEDGVVELEVHGADLAGNIADSSDMEDGRGGQEGNLAAGELRGMFRDVAARVMSGSNQTLGDFMAGLSHDEDEGSSLYARLTSDLMSLLTFADLSTLISGQNYGALDRVAPQARRLLSDHYFDGAERPTESQITAFADQVVHEDTHDWTPVMGAFVVKDNIDLVASFNCCEQRMLEDVLKILYGYLDVSGSLGQALVSRVTRSLRQLIAVGIHSLRGGREECERLVDAMQRQVVSGLPPAYQDMMLNTISAQLRPMFDLAAQMSSDEIQQFIVPPTPAEVDMLPLESAVSRVTVDGSDSEEFVDAREAPGEDQRASNGVSAAAAVDIQATNEWKLHLPNDWVSVIEADITRQATMDDQAPFSDAYVSGMPVKRRKAIMKERVENQMTDLLLQRSLRDTVTRLGVQTVTGENVEDVMNAAARNEGLCRRFRDALNERIRRRLREDPDYDAVKFPNAQDFFKP